MFEASTFIGYNLLIITTNRISKFYFHRNRRTGHDVQELLLMVEQHSGCINNDDKNIAITLR